MSTPRRQVLECVEIPCVIELVFKRKLLVSFPNPFFMGESNFQCDACHIEEDTLKKETIALHKVTEAAPETPKEKKKKVVFTPMKEVKTPVQQDRPKRSSPKPETTASFADMKRDKEKQSEKFLEEQRKRDLEIKETLQQVMSKRKRESLPSLPSFGNVVSQRYFGVKSHFTAVDKRFQYAHNQPSQPSQIESFSKSQSDSWEGSAQNSWGQADNEVQLRDDNWADSSTVIKSQNLTDPRKQASNWDAQPSLASESGNWDSVEPEAATGNWGDPVCTVQDIKTPSQSSRSSKTEDTFDSTWGNCTEANSSADSNWAIEESASVESNWKNMSHSEESISAAKKDAPVFSSWDAPATESSWNNSSSWDKPNSSEAVQKSNWDIPEVVPVTSWHTPSNFSKTKLDQSIRSSRTSEKSQTSKPYNSSNIANPIVDNWATWTDNVTSGDDGNWKDSPGTINTTGAGWNDFTISSGDNWNDLSEASSVAGENWNNSSKPITSFRGNSQNSFKSKSSFPIESPIDNWNSFETSGDDHAWKIDDNDRKEEIYSSGENSMWEMKEKSSAKLVEDSPWDTRTTEDSSWSTKATEDSPWNTRTAEDSPWNTKTTEDSSWNTKTTEYSSWGAKDSTKVDSNWASFSESGSNNKWSNPEPVINYEPKSFRRESVKRENPKPFKRYEKRDSGFSQRLSSDGNSLWKAPWAGKQKVDIAEENERLRQEFFNKKKEEENMREAVDDSFISYSPPSGSIEEGECVPSRPSKKEYCSATEDLNDFSSFSNENLLIDSTSTFNLRKSDYELFSRTNSSDFTCKDSVLLTEDAQISIDLDEIISEISEDVNRNN